MNKSMLTGVVLGGLVAVTGGAFATYKMVDKGPEFAQVVEVEPVKETIKTPRQVCKDVTVVHRKPVQDEHNLLGTAIGAVVGGVAGKQVGGGSGKKIATVAGAVAGGYAGNRVQENLKANDTYTTTESQCHTVTDTSEKLIGYKVKYQLGEQQGSVLMDHNPGAQIPVKDGQLVLTKQS